MTNPARSKVAQKLQVGERVLVDGKRATFIGISDGKELYDFSLEPEGAAYVYLEDLDRLVRREPWEDDPEPDWMKEAEDFLRWNSLRYCHPHPDDTDQAALKKAVRIIQGLVRKEKGR